MQIVGHQKIKDYFEKIEAEGHFSHAYLFSGPQNVGKTTFAINLAKMILCSKEPKCFLKGKERLCLECQQVERQNHPDLTIIDSNEAIKIETIRNLKNFLSLKPYQGQHKVIIIAHSENMTIEAANSLLKSLEEPNKHIVFALTCDDLNLLPQTIVSRCQIVNFGLVNIKEIQQEIANLGFGEKSFELAMHSGGRPGIILGKDDPGFLEKKKESIENSLKILSKSYSDKFRFAEDLSNDPILANEILDFWELLLRNVLLYQNGAQKDAFVKDQVQKLSNKISQELVLKLLKDLRETKKYFSTNANKRLLLENLLLKFDLLNKRG